jgi:hypothetical protein
MSKQITKLVAQIWDKISAPMTSMLHTKPPTPTYEFIEDPIDDTTHIHITSGDYAGVVFRYFQLRFVPNTDELKIKFNYRVVRNPYVLTDEELQPIITVVLDDILKKEADAHG